MRTSGAPTVWFFGLLIGLSASSLTAAQLRVPAFTAYALPTADGVRISPRGGVTRWTDPAISVNWYGQFKQAGDVNVQVLLRLPPDTQSRLKFTVGDQSRETAVQGGDDRAIVTADFGTFRVSAADYQRFALESLNAAGQSGGEIEALLLDGPAVDGAHFNMKERRNAASVHLMYPIVAGTQVAAFYCEVTALEDPTATFYMACGWHRGYFGMQVNSPTERRIIFSVWDSGNEAVDRDKVADENRVRLLGKGEDVFAGDFGNEGTGGHSHLKYSWKTGEPQRFLVTAQPVEETCTVFSGYYFRPDRQQWMLISAWKAPHEGGYLRGLHSFSENFWGDNGHLVRKALFGQQWIRTDAGQWVELTEATFSHDPTGQADRLDRCMGVEQDQFFLSHGGFVPGFTRYGEKFVRPASDRRPAAMPYLDGRPVAARRCEANDQGVVLAYGDGPDGCDQLGAREAIVFESEGTFYLHYDGAGPRGWLACLATSQDLVHWTKRGPILDFGAPGAPDAGGACAPWVFRDADTWHMFYVGATAATPPPECVPAVPYLTCTARSDSPGGPWTKQVDVVPFRPQPGTYYADTASAGAVIRHRDEYLMYFSAAAGQPLRRTLGIARTRDLNGSWAIDPQPILPLDEQIENSSLYFEPAHQTWFLFTNHVGVDARGEYTDAVWVYWTQDPTRWDPAAKAVVLDGLNCTWSRDCIGMPTVIPVANRLAVLYDAPGGDSISHVRRSVGLAWLDLPLKPPVKPFEQ